MTFKELYPLANTATKDRIVELMGKHSRYEAILHVLEWDDTAEAFIVFKDEKLSPFVDDRNQYTYLVTPTSNSMNGFWFGVKAYQTLVNVFKGLRGE